MLVPAGRDDVVLVQVPWKSANAGKTQKPAQVSHRRPYTATAVAAARCGPRASGMWGSPSPQNKEGKRKKQRNERGQALEDSGSTASVQAPRGADWAAPAIAKSTVYAGGFAAVIVICAPLICSLAVSIFFFLGFFPHSGPSFHAFAESAGNVGKGRLLPDAGPPAVPCPILLLPALVDSGGKLARRAHCLGLTQAVRRARTFFFFLCLTRISLYISRLPSLSTACRYFPSSGLPQLCRDTSHLHQATSLHYYPLVQFYRLRYFLPSCQTQCHHSTRSKHHKANTKQTQNANAQSKRNTNASTTSIDHVYS